MTALGRRLLVSAALLGATAAGCATEQAAGARPPATGFGTGRAAPEIIVQRLNGQSLAVSSLRGKVVLLDVWATWCAPCVKELPMLDGIARRLRDKGVEVVAVSVDQDRVNVTRFLESQPGWALTVAHDPEGAIADTLRPEKMPTSFVIDRGGIIRYVNEGFEPADAPALERKLAEMADQTGAAAASGAALGGGKNRPAPQ